VWHYDSRLQVCLPSSTLRGCGLLPPPPSCREPSITCGTTGCCAPSTATMNSDCIDEKKGICQQTPKCDPTNIPSDKKCTSAGYVCDKSAPEAACGPKCCRAGSFGVPADGIDWPCSMANGRAKCCPPGRVVSGPVKPGGELVCCEPGDAVVGDPGFPVCCPIEQVTFPGPGQSDYYPLCYRGNPGYQPKPGLPHYGQFCLTSCYKFDGVNCMKRNPADKRCVCAPPV